MPFRVAWCLVCKSGSFCKVCASGSVAKLPVLMTQVAEQLLRVLTPCASGIAPVSNYAMRVMRFFLGSLRNRYLSSPPSLSHAHMHAHGR